MAPRSILIVTNRAPWPLHDGGALAMHQLITGYKAQGWIVHLLAMNSRRHWVEAGELRSAYACLDSVAIVPFDNRVRPAQLVRNLVLSRQPEHAERFYNTGFEQALLDAVQSIGPDVVQMESLFLTGYLPAIRAISSAVLVLRMHNVEHQIWQRASREAKGAKRFYLHSLARRMKRYEQWAWDQYNLLLPITPDDAKTVQETGGSTRMQLTPFGIQARKPTEHPAILSTQPHLKIYHLGAMDWLPNREAIKWFICDVWPHIRAVSATAEFHFGGRLLEEDFAAPLPAGVVNHGEVGNAEDFAAGMDALVVPLRSGGGIRVKILEAMAAGKLVLSTSVGIQGIGVKDRVHYLRTDTPIDYAKAVQWITEHRAEVSHITGAANAFAREEYDAQKIIARLNSRLHQLLQESR